MKLLVYLNIEIPFVTCSQNMSLKISNEFYVCKFFNKEVSQDFSGTSKYSAGGLQMTITEWTVYAVLSFIVVLWCYFKWKQRPFEKVALKMTGPQSYPIIGFLLEIMGTP